MKARLQKMSLSEAFRTVHTASIASTLPSVGLHVFEPFDSTIELWPDYFDRFLAFAGAHSVNDDRIAQIFLTNHSRDVYSLLGSLAKQRNPSKRINHLTMDRIVPS